MMPAVLLQPLNMISATETFLVVRPGVQGSPCLTLDANAACSWSMNCTQAYLALVHDHAQGCFLVSMFNGMNSFSDYLKVAEDGTHLGRENPSLVFAPRNASIMILTSLLLGAVPLLETPPVRPLGRSIDKQS